MSCRMSIINHRSLQVELSTLMPAKVLPALDLLQPRPPKGSFKSSFKGDIDMDTDVEVDVDIDRYFGCLGSL